MPHSWHMKVASLAALHTGHLYLREMFLIFAFTGTNIEISAQVLQAGYLTIRTLTLIISFITIICKL
jgi:hypothetical protein